VKLRPRAHPGAARFFSAEVQAAWATMGRAAMLGVGGLNGLDATEEGREMEMKPGRTPLSFNLRDWQVGIFRPPLLSIFRPTSP